MTGTLLPSTPGFVPPPIAENLARGFEDEPSFYVMDEKPIVREMHPFLPILHGKEITEAQFRARVRAIHHIG